jgi:hypothetical protein
VESFDYCQYKAERGIRVDGYNLVEEDGVLNLFISDFRNSEKLKYQNMQTVRIRSMLLIFSRIILTIFVWRNFPEDFGPVQSKENSGKRNGFMKELVASTLMLRHI